MASKRRKRVRSCESKNRYAAQWQAERACKSMRRSGKIVDGIWLKVYNCGFCNGYHITSTRRPPD